MAKKIWMQEAEWTKEENRFIYCQALEEANILFFPEIPFLFPQEEIDFLLQQKQGVSKSRKNIAYKPKEDRITNHDVKDPKSAEKMREILRNYSHRVTHFLSHILSPYAPQWKVDYASFRPFQEKGRSLRTRARNDLLHVDAFPTRPLYGDRILRFFTNINPIESRRWLTSLPFEELAAKYAGEHGVPFPKRATGSWLEGFERKMKQWLHLPMRSPYDNFMLRMHNFLKENGDFQADCDKEHWDFPPRSCWVVFTDQVSHAALSGQYALEQTILVPREALLRPERAPVSVLEQLCGYNLALRS